MPMPRRWLLAVALAALPFGPALASPVAPDGLSDRIRLLVDRDIPEGVDVEIEVGAINPGLVLAPCSRLEPSLPSGGRLWGRTSVRVRCVEGASWTVWVPVNVRVWGDALVASRDLARGVPIAADDLRTARTELTRHGHAAALGADLAIGRLPVRSIAAGERIHPELLRTPPIVRAGDPVRIVLVGRGFAIGADGKALGAAAEGQTVAVALTQPGAPGTKALSGVARPGGIVEVRDRTPSTSVALRR
ncbi:MAG: flagella basal body P-ring formation protein FlgA [Betaproteobacteria bacterium PRO3]|nr:flagella basal body P-ring formation protein FlgA [Betaproteobacteria bacterium PRO3]